MRKTFDWIRVSKFFDLIIADGAELSPFLRGEDGTYGLVDLHGGENAGNVGGEFTSNDSRYTKRQTFALRVGYRGQAFPHGYQRIGTSDDGPPLSVQHGIQKCMGFDNRLTAAGRTDAHVSALSQVVSFVTGAEQTSENLLRHARAAAAGDLVFYDCKRVPRMFNARASALWRRYLYFIPIDERHTDIDVAFLNDVFQKIEGEELPYNAFAHKQDYKGGHGSEDLCTLLRCNARKLCPEETSSAGEFICVELVGSRFLRRMVRNLVATAVREARRPPEGDRNVQIIRTLCMKGKEGRRERAMPFPSEGLVFAGVGYDWKALSFYKGQPKRDQERLVSLFGMSAEEGERHKRKA